MNAPRSTHRAGFTLVEVVLSGTFLASLLLVAGLAMDRTISSFRQRRAEQTICGNANRLLQRLASELAFAERPSLQPATLATLGAEQVSYRICEGTEGGAAVFGLPRRIAWEPETGELDDGLDNNGNGLVDEGVAVWIESPGVAEEQRVVLGHGLSEFLSGEQFNGLDDNGNGLTDERGLCFSLEGNAVTVRASLQTAGLDGVITRTLETTVFVRN